MNILLVYPETPSTFWSFQNALKFVSKKSSEPPLGLLTIAAMLPDNWNKKLIDVNVRLLKDEDLLWADYVFLSGMSINRASFKRIVRRCNELDKPIVAGGPMVTASHAEFQGIDHLIIGEAEEIISALVEDIIAGRPKPMYSAGEFPDITKTPIPRWELLEMEKYASMSIQYSRGCPYDCEFCNITVLNGRKPRTKATRQFLRELDALFNKGWRGHVFIVDDNFIGNKKKLKLDLLPALIVWSDKHDHPFSFGTETTINLADDDELIYLMTTAGFDAAFIGIETPHNESLVECGKKQNQKRDLLAAVKKLHKAGIKVSAGFILGFDSDPADIFQRQINFIHQSNIITAMVGLLNAPIGTKLFRRMKNENRLLDTMSGDNMDGSINFIPKMSYQKLVAGYKNVLETIYHPHEYYLRVKDFLNEYNPKILSSASISANDIKALLKSIWFLGIIDKYKWYYWKLFWMSLLKYPRKFPLAITYAIYGFHFRRVVESI